MGPHRRRRCVATPLLSVGSHGYDRPMGGLDLDLFSPNEHNNTTTIRRAGLGGGNGTDGAGEGVGKRAGRARPHGPGASFVFSPACSSSGMQPATDDCPSKSNHHTTHACMHHPHHLPFTHNGSSCYRGHASWCPSSTPRGSRRFVVVIDWCCSGEGAHTCMHTCGSILIIIKIRRRAMPCHAMAWRVCCAACCAAQGIATSSSSELVAHKRARHEGPIFGRMATVVTGDDPAVRIDACVWWSGCLRRHAHVTFSNGGTRSFSVPSCLPSLADGGGDGCR